MEQVIKITYYYKVFREDFVKLDSFMLSRVHAAISAKILTNPLRFGIPLSGTLYGLLKIRVGDYRIIYQMKDPHSVLILAVMHRSKVYKELRKRV